MILERVWGWYSGAAGTRLMPGGVKPLTMTGWHEDDLAGRLLNSAAVSEWSLLRLSALADPGYPLGRAEGGVLWPSRFPSEALPSVECGEINTGAFAALHQQRPAPAGGGPSRRAWMLRRYTRLPTQDFADIGNAVAKRWIVLQVTMVADYFGTRRFATLRGLTSTLRVQVSVVSPLLVGWMFDQTGSYQLIFTVYAAAAAMGALWVLLIRRPMWSEVEAAAQ